MNLRLFFALCLLAAAPAPAQGGPDGYSCTVEAFSNIGAIDGIGVGEMSLSADRAYRAAGSSFTYNVRDRTTGLGRMTATWRLVDGKLDGAAIESIWLPFHRELGQMPAAIEVKLDEGPPVTVAITDPSTIQVGSRGGANGVTLLGKAGAAPELRGHRSFGYAAKAADGTILSQDIFLLPDWEKVPGQLNSALRRVRSDLAKRNCGAFYVVGRQPTAAGLKP
jgi:hypothetical protein